MKGKDYTTYSLLRKWTTPVHWAFGIACGVAIMEFWPLAVILMMMFGLFEWWNDKNQRTHTGDMDWWESFFTFSTTFTIIIILNLAGIISTRWWF